MYLLAGIRTHFSNVQTLPIDTNRMSQTVYSAYFIVDLHGENDIPA